MSSIDKRIVEAQFKNDNFKKGVDGTLKSLGELKQGLKLDGATQGLSEVENKANSMNFGGALGGLSALKVAGLAAFAAIGYAAVNVARKINQAFVFGAAAQGFEEFELKMGSIQTIMAGSGESLETVNRYLEELNTYSDRTIYSFADMTQNIGKFTNAGVDLETSVAAIQGIANVAALSGANANEASRAMYNFSQALSKGYVQLIDWKSIELANMGTVEFKQQLIDAAEAQGLLTKKGDEWVTTAGKTVTSTKNFNDSLTDQWLTTEVLTSTLGDYADETTEIGKRAYAAAQDIKTFSQLIDTVKEAIGSGWARTFEIVIGNFEESKELWTGVNDAIDEFVSNSSDARNEVLQDWKDMGGRTALIEGLKNAMQSFASVVRPVKEALDEFLPAISGKDLYDLTVGFRDFFETFKMGEEDAANLKSTFDGIFSAIGIGWELLTEAGGFLRDIILEVAGGADDLLEVTARMGEAIQRFYERMKEGNEVAIFFDKLTNIFLEGVDALQEFAAWMQEALGLDDFSLEAMGIELARLVEAGEVISTVWDGVADVFDAVFGRIGDAFSAIGTFIMELPANLAEYMAQVDWNLVLSSINTGLFGAFLVLLNNFINRVGNQGILGALSDLSDVFGDAVTGITSSLDRVTSTLGTMQNTLRAMTLTQIAIALGIMAWALMELSRIDSEDLAKALSAMAGLFVELGAALVGLQFLGGIEGFAKTATGLILLSTAIKILASVMEDLGALSWDEIEKGLTAVSGLLAVVMTTTALMQNPTGLISTAIGLTILAGGIKALASAVEDISNLNWDEMNRGLIGVGQLLLGLTIFTNLVKVNKGAVAQGAGIVLLATGIKILASATEDFADIDHRKMNQGLLAIGLILSGFAAFTNLTNPAGVLATGAALVMVSGAMIVMADATERFGAMSWDEIERGLTAMAGALLAVGLALSLMPPSSIISGGALAIASVGISSLTNSLVRMGEMGWGEIEKALSTLAGGLAILALGLTMMSGTITGSASLVVAAGALAILTPVLYLLGGLSWDSIGKGLAVLAGAFVILGVAGYALAPTVPTFLGLAAAFFLLGAGSALLGVGINLVAQAIGVLAARGSDLGIVLETLATAMSEMIPILAENMALGFVAFVNTIAQAADGLIDAVVVIFMSILDGVREVMPELIDIVFDALLQLLEKMEEVGPPMLDAFLGMLTGLMDAVTENAPTLVASFAEMMVALLTELAQNTSDMVGAGVALIVAFLEGLAENVGDVIAAGTDLIITLIEGIGAANLEIIEAAMGTVLTFIEGLTEAIEEYAPQIRDAGGELAVAIVDGMTGGLASAVGDVIGAAGDLASSAISSAKNVLDSSSPSKEFIKIGKWVGDGFVIGMVGSRKDILATWQKTKDDMAKVMYDTQDDIDRLRAKLEKLNSAEKKDVEAIKEVEEALAAAHTQYDKITAALGHMKRGLTEERKALINLGTQYDTYSAKLDAAEQQFADAVRTRDDYNRSVKRQFSDLPDITQGMSVQRFTNELNDARNDTLKFTTTLQNLRKKGLSDQMYKEFMDQGLDILPFLEELNSGNQAAIDRINKYSNNLAQRSARLGNAASKELYQAGVQTANGLVRGLQSKRAAVISEMEQIAADLVAVLKAKLRIESPSRVMGDLGRFTVEGMADGMTKSGYLITDAAEGAGDEALNAMKKAMSEMSDVIDLDPNLNPTVSPILDLSAFRKDAQQIGTTLSGQAIALDEARSKANYASLGYQANLEAKAAAMQAKDVVPSSEVTFIQNNNSPKSLSEAEIYRQTNNQLSRMKGALTPNVAQEA